jgi:hypothetical protein
LKPVLKRGDKEKEQRERGREREGGRERDQPTYGGGAFFLEYLLVKFDF